jgi:hypothetical protein
LRFAWTYVWCGAWRRGAHGLAFSAARAQSEFMRQAKLWELQAVQHMRHPPREFYSSVPTHGPGAATSNTAGQLDSGPPGAVETR